MNFRNFLITVALSLSVVLTGCVTDGTGRVFTSEYEAVRDAGYTIPKIPIAQVPRKFHRQIVSFETGEKPGTIVVDTKERFLYFVTEDGKAMRYGIGVGRQGFEWSGVARVAMKRDWPTWTPPAAMIRREPKLAKWKGGMPPGLSNPLGARALYLFNRHGDTGYRIHGTPEWNSIGTAASSGCIRLLNQDIVDLYERAKVGAKVIVR